MNKTMILRQGSLKYAKFKPEINEASPYLKPVNTSMNLRLSTTCTPVGKRKRISMAALKKSSESCYTQSDIDFEPKSSSSIETILRTSHEISFESQETIAGHIKADYLCKTLEERLKDVEENNYKDKFDVFSAVFDIFVAAYPVYSEILMKLKNGIIETMKSFYKAKISTERGEMLKKNSIIEKLKIEKERIIGKLNELSSQNINLMSTNEDLMAKLKLSEEILRKHIQKNGTSTLYVAELHKKSEKIRELTDQLDEMKLYESKVMTIVDKLRGEGVNFEKLYQETAVRRESGEKKLRRTVPPLKVSQLDCDDVKIN